jgi:hypothetical protein
VAQVRALEFYMPVAAHRGAWEGGDNLWIASYLEDDGSEAPAVFSVDGNTVPLWAKDAEPAVPTLVLVPVETRFDRPLAQGYQNKGDRGGRSIGTLQAVSGPSMTIVLPEECGTDPTALQPTCDGGGGTYIPPTTTKPAGLYMQFAYGDQNVPDGTWGLKGEPEIEMHIFGITGADPTTAKSLACSHADHSETARRFDMNDHNWTGDVLLFSQTQISSYYAATTQDYSVQMWEDDDTTCQPKTDKDLTGFLQWLVGAYNSNAVKTDSAGTHINAGKLWNVIVGLASWLQSNDDFVGNAQFTPGVYTDATHTLMMPGDTNNGRIKLVRRY